MSSEEEADLLQQMSFILDKLLASGFFRCGRSGLEIYHEVEARIRWSPYLRPRYIKQMLYQEIGTGSLSLKASHGQLQFQDARLNAMRNPIQKNIGQLKKELTEVSLNADGYKFDRDVANDYCK